MKIFISHSSKDKWAARRISKDLEDLGYTTFLDEKDIRTGQSLDSAIKDNLKECDDFLILLSPSSIKSEWVLVELGGAIALEKRIVPILLYVGANEIPQIISLKLARDINDIDRYYQELPKVQPKESIEPIKLQVFDRPIRPSRFQVGDKVKITNEPQPDLNLVGMPTIDWEKQMDKYLKREAVISEVLDLPFGGMYLIDVDNNEKGGGYVWAEEWLTEIE